MVSLRTILSKKMPTGSQPEEPFDAMAFAHQQTEWYNNAEGHLDQEDGYDCPICRNKGYLRVVTEEGGIPNAWMRPCQCQKVRQSIRQMRRSGLQHIIQDYTFAKFQATEPWQQKLKGRRPGLRPEPGGLVLLRRAVRQREDASLHRHLPQGPAPGQAGALHALAGRREPHQGRGQPGGGVQRRHRPL